MAIRLRLVTALVRRDAVEADYAGGAEAFRRDYPQAEEDAGLFGLHAMSGGEIEQLLARIAAKGVRIECACAVGDMWAGSLSPCQGITFDALDSGGRVRSWFAWVAY